MPSLQYWSKLPSAGLTSIELEQQQLPAMEIYQLEFESFSQDSEKGKFDKSLQNLYYILDMLK